MTRLHKCEPGDSLEEEEYFFQHGGYGPAVIEYCEEDEERHLWCYNSEYSLRVNFCPFCGYRAPRQVEVEGDG